MGPQRQLNLSTESDQCARNHRLVKNAACAMQAAHEKPLNPSADNQRVTNDPNFQGRPKFQVF